MIERLLPPLLAAVVLAPAASAQDVRLSVTTGRAVLVTDHGVSPLTRGRGLPPVSGPGHFELAPGSRASLKWVGRCSLELRGPVSVSWQSSTDGEGLELDFSALREADLEVRSGPVRVGLPGAWRARVSESVCSLYGLPSGGVELVHRAGREARATWVGGEGFAPPPVSIRAGERARLQGQPAVPTRGAADRSAPGWGTSSWPWGEGGVPNAPDLALRNVPSWDTDSPWPWPEGAGSGEVEPWQRWDWPWQAPEEEGAAPDPNELAPEAETPSGATDAAPGPQPWSDWHWPWEPRGAGDRDGGAEPGEGSEPHPDGELPVDPGDPEPGPRGGDRTEAPPSDPEHEALAATAPEAPPEVPAHLRWDAPTERLEPPAAYEAEHWRGLPEAAIEFHERHAIQLGPPFEVRPLKDGARELWLPPSSSEPLWYFSPNLDLRLFPGASLVLEADGSIRYHRGTVRILSADPARRF